MIMREEVGHTLSSLRLFFYFVSYFVFKDKERTYDCTNITANVIESKSKNKKKDCF